MKPREFWVGYTESGFAKWLTEKNPENDSCPYSFFSFDGREHCEEIAVLAEVQGTKFKPYGKTENSPNQTAQNDTGKKDT